MRVLLAEDDAKLGKLIEYMMQQNRIEVDWVTDGAQIVELASFETYDVLVLDWMLPSVSGVEACRQLRSAGYERSILILTARDAVEDRVAGLDAGADDYLVKPFEFAELMARIRALARRSSHKLQHDVMKLGSLTLNRTVKSLTKGDMEVQLSPREYEILDLLAQNIGRAVPREVILDRIWGIDADISSNNVDSYVKLLRKKLEEIDSGDLIQTVRGVGYRLEEA